MKKNDIRRRIILWIQIFSLITAAIVCGIFLMTLVFMLPTDIMKEHVTSSIDIFYTESVYPQQVQGYKSTQLDNETDAIMLLGAIHESKQLSPLQQAVAVPHATISGVNSKCIVLKNYLWDDIMPDGEANYDRYWHGYMLYLKPLLLIMDYADIRILNMILQLLLLVYLIHEMVRKHMEAAVLPLGIYLAIINPAATAMSLQFSSMYYIVMISLLVLVRYNRRIVDSNLVYFFFTGVGISVAFFDFLTYPTAAFVVPSSLAVVLNDQKNWKERVSDLVYWGVCWGIGYIGMWAGKWIVGSLILDTNILGEAVGRMLVHSGEAVQSGGEALSAWAVLWKNMKVLFRWPYFFLGMAMAIYYGRIIFPKLNRKTLALCLPYVLLCTLPCIWIMALKSHSLWCYWYTYRNLGGTVFAIGLMLKSIASDDRYGVSHVSRL